LLCEVEYSLARGSKQLAFVHAFHGRPMNRFKCHHQKRLEKFAGTFCGEGEVWTLNFRVSPRNLRLLSVTKIDGNLMSAFELTTDCLSAAPELTQNRGSFVKACF
jgi:hypothetical protein